MYLLFRSHTCVAFSNGRASCVGGYNPSAGSGFLGVPFATAQAVATCGFSSCLPVSSIGFISFSDNTPQVVAIETGESVTCGT
jgi:hypothetical protein